MKYREKPRTNLCSVDIQDKLRTFILPIFLCRFWELLGEDWKKLAQIGITDVKLPPPPPPYVKQSIQQNEMGLNFSKDTRS